MFTNLGEGLLLLSAMSARETLGRPFCYELTLLSRDENLDLSALLGQPIAVTLELADGTLREFCGIVTHFSLAGELGRFVRYEATVRPWLWLLSQRKNSRIFQGKTALEVIETIFREHGFTDFSKALSVKYRPWEYLVQYRESDLNFVSRLMEQEGIYYFFKHEGGKHTLVLADSYSSHKATPGYETVPYFPPQVGERREQDFISSWTVTRQIRPGAFAARDFNFLQPSVLVAGELAKPNDHERAEYEVFDYPGEFKDKAEATTQAQVRLEELQANHEVAQGTTNARGLSVGGLFKLSNFPREDQNKEYLLVEVTYEIVVTGFESGSTQLEPPDLRLSFKAIDSHQPYRAPRLTRKPRVEGPQTAIVVGQAGQEIWTDEFGRVKVQFHWDRVGQSNEDSSCYVRVSQIWAGSGFGGIHIPRMGQEVIVDFLEGDPDRPIITGRVYNQDNMPPYTLPDNATQSGIKTRSTKGGGPSNANEIRFEDKKGREDLLIHAERSQTTVVEGSQSISVGGERSITVTAKDTETFKAAREVNVNSTDLLIITDKHSGYYNNGRESFIGPLDFTYVDGVRKTEVKGDYKITATAEYLVIQGANMIDLKGSLAVFTNDDSRLTMDAGNTMLAAADKITVMCGGSTITLAKSGEISIRGSKIELAADEITITGETSVTVTGGSASKVELAAASAKVSGTVVDIAGSTAVKINS